QSTTFSIVTGGVGFPPTPATVLTGLKSFRLSLPPSNAPPIISEIPQQIIAPNSSTGPLPFTATDPDGDDVTVDASSSNQNLVPNSNLAIELGVNGRI